jgi:hypothetical protein
MFVLEDACSDCRAAPDADCSSVCPPSGVSPPPLALTPPSVWDTWVLPGALIVGGVAVLGLLGYGLYSARART